MKLLYPREDTELAFLLGNDTDAFNRWDAGQQAQKKIKKIKKIKLACLLGNDTDAFNRRDAGQQALTLLALSVQKYKL